MRLATFCGLHFATYPTLNLVLLAYVMRHTVLYTATSTSEGRAFALLIVHQSMG